MRKILGIVLLMLVLLSGALFANDHWDVLDDHIWFDLELFGEEGKGSVINFYTKDYTPTIAMTPATYDGKKIKPTNEARVEGTVIFYDGDIIFKFHSIVDMDYNFIESFSARTQYQYAIDRDDEGNFYLILVNYENGKKYYYIGQ